MEFERILIHFGTTLLSRAGLLEEAKDLITNSPFANLSSELWRIVHSSCVILKYLSVGVGAAERIIALDPRDCSTDILLSNFYALFGEWEEVAEKRERIRELMLEIKDSGHVFTADG